MASRFPNREEEQAFHDDWARLVRVEDIDVEREFAGLVNPENLIALSYIGSLEGRRILDAGCGYGVASVYLASRGALVTSLDISSQMLARTRELARRYGVSDRIRTVECALEEIRADAQPYDAVYGYGVLHHASLESALRAVRQCLKPRGKAVFIEPLGLNPVVNLYRRLSPGVRTAGERPLGLTELRLVRDVFPLSSHEEAQLLSMGVYGLLVLSGRLNLGTERLWKALHAPEYQAWAHLFALASRVDRWILRALPPLGLMSWATVIKASKGEGETD